MDAPTVKQKRELHQALVRYLEEKHAPRRVAVIDFLFEESIARKASTRDGRITAVSINESCPATNRRGGGSRESDLSSTSALMSRLYTALDTFFASPEGAELPFRIVRQRVNGKIDRDNFALGFEPQCGGRPGDAVTAFWRPYINSGTVRILYPELRSMMDRDTQTYFRNPMWDRARVLKHLNLADNEHIEMSYSFVSSGLVAGMSSIVEYLNNHHHTKLEIDVVRPDVGMNAIRHRPQNTIVLGTATSTELLTLLEEKSMHTSKGAVIVNPGTHYQKRHADRSQTQDSGIIEWKHGVLTRRPHPDSTKHVITVLAGQHGRAVEGMAKFLTDKDLIEQVTRSGHGLHTFQRFQALFQVQLKKAPTGDPEIQDIKLLKVKANRTGRAELLARSQSSTDDERTEPD